MVPVLLRLLPSVTIDVKICDSSYVANALCNLKTSKAMGSDFVPPTLLKLSAEFISQPLCFIYNLSFNTACVPHLWKMAHVIPVPKTYPVKCDQLRPISLLPEVSKIFERLILQLFKEDLVNFYDDCQYAYRKSSSTVCALLSIQDHVLSYLDDPNIGAVRIIALDMSHAFDSVPHELLLKHVADLNFSGAYILSSWLRSYLSLRKQRVRIGDVLSSPSAVTSGVPQGSILGPILFSIFMSTYCPTNHNTRVAKYADDITLIVPVNKSSFGDFSLVNTEIGCFKAWCVDNFMTINHSKTKVLNINVTTSPLPDVPLMNNVITLKILGLIFCKSLLWSPHFDFMIPKLSRRL